MVFEPGVKGRLRFLQKRDFTQTRLCRGFECQCTGHFVERRGNGDHRMIKCCGRICRADVREKMGKELTRDFERGELFLHRSATPWKDRASPVGMRVAEPAFCGSDQAIGLQGSAVAGEGAEEGMGFCLLPGELRAAVGKLACSGNVER